MGDSFGKWVGQCILFTVLTMMVFLGLRWFQIPAGDMALWVSGVAVYWVLSGITILPWNMHFKADDVLEEMKTTEEKGGKINEREREYVLRAKKKSGIIAVSCHLLTASVFFGLALFTQLGSICYLAAGAALGLTFLRPAVRSVEHILFRLEKIREKVQFPRDDVFELKERVAKLEHYDERAKEWNKTFERIQEELEGNFKQQSEAIHGVSEKTAKRVRELEVLILRMQSEITGKIDSFDDALAFKTAWERVVPELARIFRDPGIQR